MSRKLVLNSLFEMSSRAMAFVCELTSERATYFMKRICVRNCLCKWNSRRRVVVDRKITKMT